MSQGPRRFYEDVQVASRGGRHEIWLDGKPAKTPAGAILALPSRSLAEAVAREWQRQGTRLDPRTMPLTTLANTAIDGVTPRRGEVEEEILDFAANDLLCYGAEGPASLVARQEESWGPLLSWAREVMAIPFVATQGLMPVPQPEAVIAAMRAYLARFDPYQLTAFHVMAGLSRSVILALAVSENRLSAEAAWAAACLDESWQADRWGEDAEAAAHRKAQGRAFTAAAQFFALSREEN